MQHPMNIETHSLHSVSYISKYQDNNGSNNIYNMQLLNKALQEKELIQFVYYLTQIRPNKDKHTMSLAVSVFDCSA